MPIRKVKETSLMEILKEHNPKQMSNGQIRCECPFHENHTDGSGRMSFYCSPDINAYHCFSCGAKGNLIGLLTTRFDVGYFTAVELVRLTDYTGKEAKEFDLDITWDFRVSPKDFLKRGFTKETLKHFRIGMADDGMIVIPFYKDFNRYGDLLGYQKRINYPDRIVLNSKGFNKKEYLYNVDTSYSYVVVVEGYSDVMRLYQHGYNAVALLGADMSAKQAELLYSFERVYLALDNDMAGRRATEICNHLLKNHVEVKLVPYRTKDPGECTSKEEWEESFQEATDYLAYSMEMCMEWDDYMDMRDRVINELMRR